MALTAQANVSLTQTVLDYCLPRRMLLVMDNCEHVLAAASELVTGLSEGSSVLRVLATSREPLEAPDEQRWPVSPLPVPHPDAADITQYPAVGLFVERLSAVRPNVDLSGQDGRDISRICAAVGGLPLGVELAAAHARSFELAEIADTLLTNPSRLARLGAGPPRQASMLDTVEWSYRLLDPDQQILHRRLACIGGALTLEAATALCRVPPLQAGQAMELLAGLVHRSLLVSTRPTGPGRPTTFSQLVPIRAHAEVTLSDPAERAALEKSRDDWVFGHILHAPHDGRPGQAQFYDWLEDNQASVRATLTSMLLYHPDERGLQLTIMLGQYWFDRNRLIEGGRWARAAVALTNTLDLDELAVGMAHALLGCMLALGPDPQAARQILQDSVSALRDPPAHKIPVVGQVLVLASLSGFLGLHWDLGLDAAQAAIVLGQTSGEPHLILRGRALRAANALMVTGPDTAVPEADAVLSTIIEVPNAQAELNAAVTRSAAARMTGDGDAGVYWTGRAVAANRSAGAVNIADLAELLGAHLLTSGQPQEALRCFAAAAAVHARSGLPGTRRVGTAPSLATLQALIPGEEFQRIWASGERMGRADPEQFINEWL